MNWESIILLVLTVILVLAGGYIKRLVKEFRELIDAISEAIEDDKIDDKELAEIISAGQSVKDTIFSIVLLFNKR